MKDQFLSTLSRREFIQFLGTGIFVSQFPEEAEELLAIEKPLPRFFEKLTTAEFASVKDNLTLRITRLGAEHEKAFSNLGFRIEGWQQSTRQVMTIFEERLSIYERMQQKLASDDRAWMSWQLKEVGSALRALSEVDRLWHGKTDMMKTLIEGYVGAGFRNPSNKMEDILLGSVIFTLPFGWANLGRRFPRNPSIEFGCISSSIELICDRRTTPINWYREIIPNLGTRTSNKYTPGLERIATIITAMSLVRGKGALPNFELDPATTPQENEGSIRPKQSTLENFSPEQAKVVRTILEQAGMERVVPYISLGTLRAGVLGAFQLDNRRETINHDIFSPREFAKLPFLFRHTVRHEATHGLMYLIDHLAEGQDMAKLQQYARNVIAPIRPYPTIERYSSSLSRDPHPLTIEQAEADEATITYDLLTRYPRAVFTQQPLLVGANIPLGATLYQETFFLLEKLAVAERGKQDPAIVRFFRSTSTTNATFPGIAEYMAFFMEKEKKTPFEQSIYATIRAHAARINAATGQLYYPSSGTADAWYMYMVGEVLPVVIADQLTSNAKGITNRILSGRRMSLEEQKRLHHAIGVYQSLVRRYSEYADQELIAEAVSLALSGRDDGVTIEKLPKEFSFNNVLVFLSHSLSILKHQGYAFNGTPWRV